MIRAIRRLFDLRHDQDEYESIDVGIRDGVRVGGTNLWVLIFAILIASVGLNMNSTAVVIGAMLISPLMRPILGIGYGAGIYDYRLIRTSARSLAIFAGLSILTSTTYFLLSPLSQVQSELLARTTPTLWDVLIAFFGGCAAIIAQTRREESTVIPGAAIATALMPPLCTVGFGLATANWEFVFGAAYLFAINAFFIALATFMFVRLLAFPEHTEADSRLQRRAHFAIALGVLAMAVPSANLAYGLVQDQLFLLSSKRLIGTLSSQRGAIVLTTDVSPKARHIAVTMGGEVLPAAVQQSLLTNLKSEGFTNATLDIRHIGQERVDLVALRDQLRGELYASTVGQLEDRTSRLDALTLELAKQKEVKTREQQVIQEVLAQYPSIVRMSVGDGVSGTREGADNSASLLVMIEAKPALAQQDMERIQAGLTARMPGMSVQLMQAPEEKPRKKKR